MRKTEPEELVPGALEKYTHDLTALARQGRFMPLQRREGEIGCVLQVLARRLKHSPVLIGEDSAERFAVVAEVVRRISIGDMPEIVRNRLVVTPDVSAIVPVKLRIQRVVALDLEKLSADAQKPGDFEKLLGAVVAEVAQSEGQTLLFIDNMQALLSGEWAKGDADAAKAVMHPLARGEIVVMGTMTRDDYRKYMMLNAARYRKCQEVFVCEFSE